MGQWEQFSDRSSIMPNVSKLILSLAIDEGEDWPETHVFLTFVHQRGGKYTEITVGIT